MCYVLGNIRDPRALSLSQSLALKTGARGRRRFHFLSVPTDFMTSCRAFTTETRRIPGKSSTILTNDTIDRNMSNEAIASWLRVRQYTSVAGKILNERARSSVDEFSKPKGNATLASLQRYVSLVIDFKYHSPTTRTYHTIHVWI